MRFRISSTFVIISPFFLILFFLMVMVIGESKILVCFLSILVHEFGHILMIILLRQRIAVIKVFPFGFSCRLWNQKYINKSIMFAIIIAGPAANFALAAFAFYWLRDFAITNLVIGFFNLIPFGELDGGRLIKFV